MRNIYLIIGASGVGKTTVVNELSKRYGLKQLSSYTNREPRYEGEVGHTFIDKTVFPSFDEIVISYPDIVGRTVYNGHCYFATAQQVDEADLYVIDPAGVEFFKHTYSGSKGVRVINLYESEQTRRKRMLIRGDSIQQIRSRLDCDFKCFFYDLGTLPDKIIINGDLDACVEEVWEFIKHEEEI